MSNGIPRPLSTGPESIEIKNFLAIRSGKITLNAFTTIIGPQASGKSTIVKLVFFARNFVTRYFRTIADSERDIRNYKRDQLENFLYLFGDLEGYNEPFEVRYVLGTIEVTIKRKTRNRIPAITIGKNLQDTGARLQRDHENYDRRRSKNEHLGHPMVLPSYWNSTPERAAFFESCPTTLFIPASRSLFSTASDQLLSDLASEDELDPFMMHFGGYYRLARRSILRGRRDEFNTLVSPIIDGSLVRMDSREFIVTSRGRVPLPNASSGQKEALPLLLAVVLYPAAGAIADMMIIERPETQLFPESQKHTLDLIADMAANTGCSMLVTTHSPYIIAFLNNHIIRWGTRPKKDRDAMTAGAYLVSDGEVRSIMDSEDGLIDMNVLDEVSEEIVSEFLDAYGE